MSEDAENFDVSHDLVEFNAKKVAKNPKSSARSRYNRRKLWLAHSLEQMGIAIDNMLAQDGLIYKREEIDTLKDAIANFTSVTGLKAPELEPPTQEELDGFIDMLENLQPWEPPSKEELAKLYASVNLELPPDDEE